jgi:hypothetical protein
MREKAMKVGTLESVEFWIQAAPPPSSEELNFLREQFDVQQGKRVLDIPCGAGRHMQFRWLS